MTNKQLARKIRELMRVRKAWIDILTMDNERTDAPVHILSLSAKIELLRTYWQWNDEEEAPYGNN